MQKRRKAFTLVELVIVIAVIAVLSAILVPTFSGIITNAQVTKLQADVHTFNQNLLLRSLTVDGRENYTADEVKHLAEEYGFDRASTPNGYSLWYDRTVNNVFLLKNDVAFSSANPAKSSTTTETAGITTVYADEEKTVVKGDRPIEALNPYNNNLFYIDGTNVAIEKAINQLKSVIQTAEKNGGDSKSICDTIVNEYENKLQTIANEIKNDINLSDLKASYDVQNTMFIGENGIYVPASETSTTVTVTNYLVDNTITDITKGFKSGNTNVTITVNIEIVIPSNVTNVSGDAFTSQSGGGVVTSGNLTVVVSSTTNVDTTGNTGASIKVTKQNSAIDTDNVIYENAEIALDTDYTCKWPTNGQYVYYANGMQTANLDDEGETLDNVAKDSSVKYLIPVFEIKVDEYKANGVNTFCNSKNVNDFTKISVSSVKSGDLTVYSVIMIRKETNNEVTTLAGYKFSNVGYITNVNAYTTESYNVLNHTGNSAAFPTSGKAKITVKLPDGTEKLGNLKDLKVKVTYAPVVNTYEQSTLKDGTIYYVKKDSQIGTSKTTELKDVESNKCEFDVDVGGLATGNYVTYSSVVQKVEVYSGDTLILVRNYSATTGISA